MSLRRIASTVVLVGVFAAGGIVAGCGDDADEPERLESAGQSTAKAAPPSGGPAKASAKVTIKEFEFAPESVSVKSGGTVTWTNQDKAPHDAENSGEPGPAQFKTKSPLNQGDSDTVTFSKPGTYTYFCSFHRFMKADVIVK